MIHPEPLDAEVARDWPPAVAIQVVIFLQRAIIAIWRVHGDEMNRLLDSRYGEQAAEAREALMDLGADFDDHSFGADIPF